MPKQTGPKTPEGKARSSQNVLKHGLSSTRLWILCNEDAEAFEEMIKTWTDKLQPRDKAEEIIVTDIAHATWQIGRARIWESGMVSFEMDEQADHMAATFKAPIDEGTRMACTYTALAEKSRALDAHLRYERAARRAFRNGLAALEQLRAMSGAQTPAAETPETEGNQTRTQTQTQTQASPQIQEARLSRHTLPVHAEASPGRVGLSQQDHPKVRHLLALLANERWSPQVDRR